MLKPLYLSYLGLYLEYQTRNILQKWLKPPFEELTLSIARYSRGIISQHTLDVRNIYNRHLQVR